MNFVLKIVEGPNRGAEIALVEGVAVTFGKGDDCDVVLADPTLPEEPLSVEASADGVTVDGKPAEPLEVMTSGATSFAIGPADAPWGALKWPKSEEKESASRADAETKGEGEKEPPAAGEAEKADGSEDSEPSKEEKRKRGGCLGCLFALLALLLVVVGLCWFFRDRIRESDRFEQFSKIGRGWYARFASESRDSKVSGEKKPTLSDVVEKYGLSLEESNDVSRVAGNFKTRRERLAATAEAYQAKPWVELDLTDDESFRTAAEDALFTLTEGALKVGVATNRFLSIVGASSSPLSLKKTLEALDADLSKLRGVDVSGVRFGAVAKAQETGDAVQESELAPIARVKRRAQKKAAAPELPVCGILTTPYPCLVMRDGRRIMEGAAIGDGVIVEIGADSVTITNSTGRFTWKP